MADYSAIIDDTPPPPPSATKKSSHPTLTNLTNSPSNSARSPPPASLKMATSPHSSHRSSFAESMRGIAPHSPRASRQPSLSQQALQDLLSNPPTKGGDPKFSGRDWKSIRVGEIVDESLVRFVEYDTSVEEATDVRVHLLFTANLFGSGDTRASYMGLLNRRALYRSLA